MGTVKKNTIDPRISQAENARPTEEAGATGLLSFAGQFQEAYLPELRYPQAWEKFNEMLRRDPTIASLRNAVNLLARTATWSVERVGSSDPDKRAAEFLEQSIADMSFTFEDIVEDMLTAIFFGWAWSEIVYKRRDGINGESESKYDDGKTGWRKFAPRRQSSFHHWELDDTGGVQGLWQLLTNDLKTGTKYVPIKTKSGCQKSLHFTAQRDMGNPEGVPILESIYESWYFVKNLQVLSGVGFERTFVGLPVFEYAEGYKPTPEDKALVEKTGRGLRQNEKAFVAAPAEIKFRLESTTNQGAGVILDAIKSHRIAMLSVLLADFIALGTSSDGGSYSLGQDKSQLFLMGIDGYLDKIAHPHKLGIFNRYAVPYLIRVNNFEGITDFPRIKHSSVQKPDLGALGTYLQSIASYIHPDEILEAALRQMAILPKADKATRFQNQNPSQNQPTQNVPETLKGNPADGAPRGNGPETGDTNADNTPLADPHPPARGQKWYFLSEWQRLSEKFEAAMLASSNGDPVGVFYPRVGADKSREK